MYSGKFLYLTIQGDDFNPSDLQKSIKLPGKIYFKNEINYVGNIKKRCIQKTNRWVYSFIAQDEQNINSFLLNQLELIIKYKNILSDFISKYNTKFDLVIYIDNKVNIKLSKKILYLINQLGLDISISII